MHFSLITPELGYEREAIRKMLTGSYGEHQWLWQLFPAERGTPRDFLFKRTDVDGLPRYHVLSERLPLSAGPGWKIQTKPYLPKLEAGDVLQFELCANPVVTRAVEGKHARHDVVMDTKRRLLAERGISKWRDWPNDDRPAMQTLVDEACRDWLTKQGARHGFQINPEALMLSGYQQHVEKSGHLRFTTVDFGGLLTVVSPEPFLQMLFAGLGHAKAFGCGLMLVKRVA